jgi:hypothetical protein
MSSKFQPNRLTDAGRLNPLAQTERGLTITRGVMNRLLQWAQTRVDDGFTEREAAYHTGVFNAAHVIKLLEKEGHRFTRVNEFDESNEKRTRYYLEVRR